MTRVLINFGKIVLVVLSGIAGAVGAFWMACWGAFWICRAIAWMTGDDRYMFLMWLMIPVGIAAAVGGFAGVATLSFAWLYRKTLLRTALPFAPERLS
jgi:hypothetical protein